MSKAVIVIDYGVGNLYSVTRALETCGATVVLSSDGAEISAAGRVVLPGVGAFADGIAGLQARGLIDPIRRYADSGRPLLGICLGMQMLSSSSVEFGEHSGLNIIPGQVIPIPSFDMTGRAQKVPYVGWVELQLSGERTWDGTLLAGVTPGVSSVYLVHSYHAVPNESKYRLAEYDYGGRKVCAAVAKGNVVGFQFHPEKSGEVGLEVLRRFLAL